MKKLFRTILAGLLIFTLANRSQAQEVIDSFLEAGIGDASKLLELYMQPAFEGLGYGMNSGWYNTAKPHKFLGFDVSASLSMARVPDSRQFLTFNNSDFTNVYYAEGNSVRIPTYFGPNLGADDLPQLSFRDFNDIDNDGDTMEELIRITAPTGAGVDEGDLPWNAVPVPMAQIGIGLFKGTEVKLRYIPELRLDEDGGNIKMFGIGIMHDIKQYLPGDKLLPFDLSVFAGYTNVTSQLYIDKDADQLIELDASSWTVQGVISKKILFFTAFAGLGYSNYDVKFNMLGNYSTESEVLVDPISLQFKNNGVRTNVGVRLKLLFLTITGEYALQEYNTITAGVGVSIR